MAKKDPNIATYKRLKSKANYVSGKGKDFNKQGRNAISDRLITKRSPQQKQAPTKNYDELIGKLQGENKDLRNQNASINKQMANKDKANKDSFDYVSKRLAASDKRTADLSEGVSAELKKLYAAKSQPAKASAPTEESSQGSSVAGALASLSNMSPGAVRTSSGSTAEEAVSSGEKSDADVAKSEEVVNKTSEVPDENAPSSMVDENGKIVPSYLVSKVFKVGEKISVGENAVFKITNLYQPRSGANSVAGKKTGVHARGVDVVSYDLDGNKTNYPISIANGEIVNIGLHGSGHAVSSSKSELGYYMDIKLASNPNKIIRMGHLDPGVMDIKSTLIGTKVSRGDTLFQGGRMSGSGTAPHVKIYMSDLDANGVAKQNYTDKGNDPSLIIKNGG
jgi:hypothetical protein